MDAIHGTNIDAGSVFGTDARLSYDVGHHNLLKRDEGF
jgi:hypothetical protein